MASSSFVGRARNLLGIYHPSEVAACLRSYTTKQQLYGLLVYSTIRPILKLIPHTLCTRETSPSGDKEAAAAFEGLSLNIPGIERTKETSEGDLCVSLDIGNKDREATSVTTRLSKKHLYIEALVLKEDLAYSRYYTSRINLPANVYKTAIHKEKDGVLMVTLLKEALQKKDHPNLNPDPKDVLLDCKVECMKQT